MVATRFYVSGKVQGVFFRGSTEKEALRLGITGSAINLDDGRVEVLALGPADAVDRLAAWLSHGPQWAHVDGVEDADVGLDRRRRVRGPRPGNVGVGVDEPRHDRLAGHVDLARAARDAHAAARLSLIHISEPTRRS